MKRFFSSTVVILAVCGMALAPAAAAGKGKAGFSGMMRSSGGNSTPNSRVKMYSSPKQLKITSNSLSAGQTLQKSSSGKVLGGTNKFSQKGTKLSLKSSQLNPTGRIHNDATAGIADAIKNGRLTRVLPGDSGVGTGGGNLPGNLSQTHVVDKGAIQGAIQNGGLTTFVPGTGGFLPTHPGLADKGRIADAIKRDNLAPTVPEVPEIPRNSPPTNGSGLTPSDPEIPEILDGNSPPTNGNPPTQGDPGAETGGGNGGLFPARPDLANNGAIQDAIQNGGLGPFVPGGQSNPGAGNGGLFPARPDLVDNGAIQDAIQDGSLRPAFPGLNPPPTPGTPPPTDTPPTPGTPPPTNTPPTPVDPNPPTDPIDPPYGDHDFPWWPGPGNQSGGGVVSSPAAGSVTVVEQPVASPAVETAAPTARLTLPEAVDLEVVDVRLVDAGNMARKLGPRYRLEFRNRGTLPAGNFQLLIMASRDGKPSAQSPLATAEVVGLAAGEETSADIRLPSSANLAAKPVLIVALDSAAQIDETDELNNVAVIDRAKIAAAEPIATSNRLAAGN